MQISDKEQLLKDYDSEYTKEKNLDIKFLLIVYLLVFIGLLVILPKIYISNQIYYTSKNINKMYHEYSALREEHTHLEHQLESMKYKSQILEIYYTRHDVK